ncbi:MAG: mechanosensitive ion channel family protein, partial [Bacteroidales bacterium]|nr:mechanosensitive ion channel family protein [Bacteroidales bacterium]
GGQTDILAPVMRAEQEVASAAHSLSNQNIFIRLGISLAIIGVMVLMTRLVNYFFRKLHHKLEITGPNIFKPIYIKKFKLLDTEQILKAVYLLLKFFKYIVYVIMAYITLPMIFALFEPTKGLASKLLDYILTPLKNAGLGIVNYIPKLITIAVTLLITHYLIRALKFFTVQIEKEKLVIPGFYKDWVQPTFNILRILVYAFTLVLIYPLLPSSESDVFKGVTVFIGVLFSLGSSSVIGNLVAGVVVTYMRPFKIGDRIKLGETVGFVVEKSATVTRIRTHKNEYVTFPNSTLLTSSITNYNFSADDTYDDGLILYTTITFGYTTPWRQVHELLINAALKTRYVKHNPMPFVLQTKLDDFYAHYQINVYTREVAKVPSIYSELYKNIQDVFGEAGLDMTVSHMFSSIPYAGITEQVEDEGEKEEKSGGKRHD